MGDPYTKRDTTVPRQAEASTPPTRNKKKITPRLNPTHTLDKNTKRENVTGRNKQNITLYIKKNTHHRPGKTVDLRFTVARPLESWV